MTGATNGVQMDDWMVSPKTMTDGVIKSGNTPVDSANSTLLFRHTLFAHEDYDRHKRYQHQSGDKPHESISDKHIPCG